MDKRKFIKQALILVCTVSICAFFAVKLNRIDTRMREMAVAKNPFIPSNIACDIENSKERDVKLTPELVAYINVVTQQPFHWLSKGFQAYAFESQDGDFVIKFFQQGRLKARPFWDKPFEYMFSKNFRDKMNSTIEHRSEIISSSKISFEEIPEETGMVFVHLNRTEKLLHGVRVVDNQGQSFKIKLDEAGFLIQRKAKYVLPTITECMKNGDIKGAETRIDQIFTLLLQLASKGMVDSDYALIRNNNIGFIKDRAIYIDTGHITKHKNLDVAKQMEYEFSSRLKPLREWIRIKYPELLGYYDNRRDAIMASLQQPVDKIAITK